MGGGPGLGHVTVRILEGAWLGPEDYLRTMIPLYYALESLQALEKALDSVPSESNYTRR